MGEFDLIPFYALLPDPNTRQIDPMITRLVGDIDEIKDMRLTIGEYAKDKSAEVFFNLYVNSDINAEDYTSMFIGSRAREGKKEFLFYLKNSNPDSGPFAASQTKQAFQAAFQHINFKFHDIDGEDKASALVAFTSIRDLRLGLLALRELDAQNRIVIDLDYCDNAALSDAEKDRLFLERLSASFLAHLATYASRKTELAEIKKASKGNPAPAPDVDMEDVSAQFGRVEVAMEDVDSPPAAAAASAAAAGPKLKRGRGEGSASTTNQQSHFQSSSSAAAAAFSSLPLRPSALASPASSSSTTSPSSSPPAPRMTESQSQSPPAYASPTPPKKPKGSQGSPR